MKYVFKTTPYAHQWREIKRMFKRGYGGGLLWDPGTGKTKTVIDWLSILHMHRDHKVERVLVVAPLSVVGVWDDEFQLHSPLWDTGDLLLHPYERGYTEQFDVEKKCLNVAIINYDSAWRENPADMIDEFDPQAVILDESHRIKKPSARRSMYMRRHNKRQYRAILTGTPIPKSFYDLYGQWVFLNKDRFGIGADDFKERYLVQRTRYIKRGGKTRDYKELRGYKNVTELRGKVKKDATTLRKDQCLDLPPEVYQRIPIDLEPATREMYDRLAREYFLELQDGAIVDAKNILAKIGKLQQIAGGWVITEQGLRQVSQAKMNVLGDLLYDRFELDKKVVIFTRFRAEVQAIRELGLTRFRVPVYVLAGGVKRAERDSARRMFQSMEGPSIFLAQIQSGGLGITLHSSHEAIFYSVTHALDDYVQARGRIHRSGQTHKVTYRHLVARDTVDEDIYAALKAKEDVTKLIMGDPAKWFRVKGER